MEIIKVKLISIIFKKVSCSNSRQE